MGPATPPPDDLVALGTEPLGSLPPAARVRGRVGRPHRRRGDRQRRARLQAARGEERGEHDAADGDPPRRAVHRDHRSSSTPSASGPPRRRGQTVVAMVAAAVFGAESPLFVAFQRCDRADPVPGGEHELQRVPAPCRDPRRGRLHAAPVLVPRRPPRLLLGDRDAGDDRRRPARRLRGRHARPHPALLGRRVRLLHAVAGRHGPALVRGAGCRLAVSRHGERGRWPADVRRPARGVGHEVRRRRVARPRAHPGPGRALLLHPAAVRGVAGASCASSRPGGAGPAPS